MKAAHVVVGPEEDRDCMVTADHRKDVGHDIASLDPRSGKLWLTESNGPAQSGDGTVRLTQMNYAWPSKERTAVGWMLRRTARRDPYRRNRFRSRPGFRGTR